MITPEVNDVDVEKLFNWSTTLELTIRNKKRKFYIRLAGDADIGRARVFALRKSNELRQKLRDESSDEFIAFVGPKGLFDRDSLVSAILLHRLKDISREAYRAVDIPFPKEPKEDSDLEAQEEYQKQVDEYGEKVKAFVSNYIEKRFEEEKAALESKTIDDLYDLYKDEQTRSLCEAEMLRVFKQMCVYLNTYYDKNFSKRVFKSYEEFDNLPQEIKEQFIQAYDDLDLDIELLKK